jgi:hypothetical protein
MVTPSARTANREEKSVWLDAPRDVDRFAIAGVQVELVARAGLLPHAPPFDVPGRDR